MIVDSIANAICTLINQAFPHLLKFISNASGGYVVAAALGMVIALFIGYKGLQRAVNGAKCPKLHTRRTFSLFRDNEVFDPEWMDAYLYAKAEEDSDA